MSTLDTDVNIIKKEALNLINELRTTQPVSENQGKEYLENKYNYLFKLTPALFNLILKDSLANDFDFNNFQKKLDTMLEYITKIKESKISQHSASEKVGIVIADEYIPKSLYKEEDLKRLYSK